MSSPGSGGTNLTIEERLDRIERILGRYAVVLDRIETWSPVEEKDTTTVGDRE